MLLGRDVGTWDKVFYHVVPAGVIEVEESVPILMALASWLNIKASRKAIEEAVQEKRPGYPKPIDRDDAGDILQVALRFDHHFWILRKYAEWESQKRADLASQPIPHEVLVEEPLLDQKRCVGSKHAEGLWQWPRLLQSRWWSYQDEDNGNHCRGDNTEVRSCPHRGAPLSKMRAVVLPCGCQRCVLFRSNDGHVLSTVSRQRQQTCVNVFRG